MDTYAFLFWMAVTRIAALTIFMFWLTFAKVSCDQLRCATIAVCFGLLVSCLTSAGVVVFVLRVSTL